MQCELLTQLVNAGLHVSRNGDHLVVAPRERLTEELRAAIRSRKKELLAALNPATDLIAAFASAIHSGTLRQCRGCRHFAQIIPAGGDDLGVSGAGWCQRYATATDPLLPFWCDGYSPIAQTNGSAK